MRIFKRAVQAVLVLSLFSFTPRAFAQGLAVNDKSPANPLLIISIPDSSALWKSLGESAFGQKLERSFALPGLVGADKAQLEKKMGFSTDPAEFFTKTVKGFDAYFVEVNDEPGLVVAVSFRDDSTAGKILDEIKADGAMAQGNANGVAATTVLDTTTPSGLRQLSLPAFQLYMVADGSTLVWSNQKTSLDSALNNEGKAIFSSDYFKRYMDQLKDEPGKNWFFGEIDKVYPYLDRVVPDNVLGAVEGAGTVTLGGRLDANKERIKISTFQHQEDMKSAMKRYVMAAPLPGDLAVLNYFPERTSVLLGTNHFDGLSILESATESVASTPDSPISSANIDQQLQSAKALLGFDVKEDLLANLGPEFGIGLTTLDTPKEGEFPFDVMLITHVKDADRFKAILKILEDTATGLAAPPPPRKPRAPVAADAPKPSPTPVPTPAIEKEDFEGETINFIAKPTGPAADMQPGYVFTKDNYFILAMNKDTLKGVLSAAKGSKGVSDSKTMKDAGEYLDKNRNVLFSADTAGIYAILDKNKEKLTSSMSADRKASFDEFLSYLQTLRSISSEAICTNQGMKKELVLLF